jgi:hypothetical protein
MNNVYDMVSSEFLDEEPAQWHTIGSAADEMPHLGLQPVAAWENRVSAHSMPPELAEIPVALFLARQQ